MDVIVTPSVKISKIAGIDSYAGRVVKMNAKRMSLQQLQNNI